MNKSFEDQWKDALGDASQTPPPEIWDRVEAELNKKKRGFLLWRNPARDNAGLFAGVAAALVLALGTTLFLVNTVAPGETVSEKENRSTEIKPGSTLEEQAAATGSESSRPVVSAVQALKKAITDRAEENIPSGLTAIEPAGYRLLTPAIQVVTDRLAPLPYNTMPVYAALPAVQVTPMLPSPEAPSSKRKIRVGFLAANAPFNPNFSAPGFRQEALSAVQSSDILLAFDKGTNTGVNGFYSNSSRTDAFSTFLQGQSVGFGLTIDRELRKRLSVETGIKFTRATASHVSNVYTLNKTTGHTESFSHANYMQSSEGKADALISVTGTSRYAYQFLSVPVLLNYEILHIGKLQMNAVAGVSTELLLAGTVVDARENEQHFGAGNSNFRTINLAGVAGVRLSYPVTSRLDINLGSSYQHFLTSGLEKKSQATFRPSMLGLNLGLSVRQ